MTSHEPHCPFCIDPNQRSTKNFRRLFDDERGVEIIFAAKDFYIVPDIAPLVPGHALVITWQHLSALSRFWLDENCAERILFERYRRWCKSNLGQELIAFEHGMGSGDTDKGSCVDHAHIHFLPLEMSFDELRSELSMFQEEPLVIDPENQYVALLVGDEPYVWQSSRYFETQVFRHYVSRKMGKRFWHWRDYVDFPMDLGTHSLVSQTQEILGKFFSDASVSSEIAARDDDTESSS